MKFIEAADFTADRPWGALNVVTMTGATSVRLHWSDQPYKWHINDGEEVFVVVDGAVDMHYRDAGQECVRTLTPGTICFAEAGDEHVAHPQGEARMLVIEKEGSV
ncbi:MULTISPECIES: cupin domain-containing protein [Corynebacterium]|uniref:cupin domain-containing protein n=1 Tax=Corynebacterium TaxID=1716 RepID=UPI0008A5581B|nr:MULTISPECIES: cupin [Corynebacterium]KAA9224203.1 cupin [Corynebacterium amycolatum]KAA9269933.1 cupin [Corynebacterium amycolatum]MBC6758472.1 cupin [Corynebacterium sp. LK24]MBC6806647.1 cupin [Corynebacterium sp. LK30]MBU5623222.1 cupin [Corynebacterium amycolatum]